VATVAYAGGGRPAKCRFCKDKVRVIDYKDVRTLQRMSTPQGKLFSRKRSGTCAAHQRQVKRAVKRARFMALLPYVGR
jgi:small subunit ribosomal protein S18